MLSQEFKIEKRELEKRLSTTIQHKLRVLLKCYTIINFQMLEQQEFSFKKTHKIGGVKMEDPKVLFGKYEVNIIDYNNIKLKLFLKK